MKKSIKTIISILITLIILGGIIFWINFKQASKPRTQVSETNNILKQDEITINNYIKIEELPEDYSFTQAIADKCVIITNNNKMYNKDKLDIFLENIDNNIPDFMRCISFTIEGDMLITDVSFEEKDNFRVCFDWTRDEFSSSTDRTYKYSRFKTFGTENTECGISYYVDNPIEGDLNKMYITGYSNDTEIINNYTINYILIPKLTDKNEKKKITIDELANKYDYNIYYYGLESVKVKIDDVEIDLEEALIQEKIKMEQIIEQAERDSEMGIIGSEMYKEGGTMEYYYNSYTIIKCHSVDGDRDVYIGIPDMRLKDVR